MAGEMCQCDETFGFDHARGTAICRKCGTEWSVRTDAPEETPAQATERFDEDAPVFDLRMVPAVDPNTPLWNLLEQWQRGGYTLPLDSAQRKLIPLQTGNYDYFAAAHAAIAAWSYINNQKHNPGMPLHWSQRNSSDHKDCGARHRVDEGDAENDAVRLLELTAKAWRGLAELQMFAQSLGAPVPPGARVPKEDK